MKKIRAFFISLLNKAKGCIKNNQIKKWMWLFIAGFFIYIGIEVLFTSITGSMIGFNERVYFSLSGYSSIWMGIIGGVLLIILGELNGINIIKKQNLFVQSLIGAAIILATEFISGYVLNIKWGLSVWDYSTYFLNVMGQINFFYAIFWFLLSPFAFWADDNLRWVFYKTGICQDAEASYDLCWFYKQLFTFKPIMYPAITNKSKNGKK